MHSFAHSKSGICTATPCLFHEVLQSPTTLQVLFVLSALLSGKRKVEVRERLTQLRLLHVLNDIFDFIFWEKKRDTQQFSQSLVSAIASALGGTAAETSAFDVSVNLAAPGGQPPGSAAAAATPGTAQPAEAQPVPNQQHAFNASHPADCDCRPEAARRIQYLRSGIVCLRIPAITCR